LRKSDSTKLALSVVLLLVIMIGIVTPTIGTASAATNSINKIQSGLVSSDSFTTGNTSGWTFGGTAALHDYYEDSQGLHLGVQAPSSGQWVNYYAASVGANAHLFHAALTIPYASVADGVFNPGLYVEGSNYKGIVGCQAYVDHTGYYWTVQSSIDAGSTWTTLYAPPKDSLPQTDDCTVMTNGNNYLKVYIGGNVVFSSTTMNLNMPTPLHAFVQADTSSSSMDYTTYSNYYSTTDENIQVVNNPSNAVTVQIVGTTGNVLATAPVSAGVATLNVGMYKFPLSGTINVYDSSNSVIASSTVNIFGGDVFSVTTSGTPTAPGTPSGLTATAISSSQINLSWIAPSSNGGSAITGYKIERSTDSGTTWSAVQSNTGSTGTTYSDIGLSSSTTYTYRVSAINSVGTGSPSHTVSATTSTASTAPGTPSSLTATAISSSQINLSWTAPSSNGGSAITGYKIERSTDGGTTWSVLVSNTGSTGTTYSDTGLAANTAYTYRVSAINSVGTSTPSNIVSATTNQQSLTLIKSGLLVSDSLSNETDTQQQLQTNSKYWRYGGDAPGENAPYAFWRNTQGLHIGVQAPSNATWAGIYSLSRNINGMLYHSIVTTPVPSIPANNVYYNNGMYVQTNGSSNVNYVTCASNVSSFGTVWAIFWATGNPFGATNFTRLWYDPSPNQPLTRDCTIITNGNNYLKVYLDGVKVVDNNKMNLQIPPPFNVFLEPQSSYAGQLLNGTFTDFYASTSENVTVTNLPSNTVRVDITDSSGNVLATSPVANQIASLNVGQYHFPLSGTIKVYNSNNALIASRSSGIYGGDVYSVNP